jgi:TPP-dependent pyruvate/acetoin dehydrogenase alpha subunit
VASRRETPPSRPSDALSAEQLTGIYRVMYTIRVFETRLYDLYRRGEIRGPTHPYLGMEAVAAGACAALRPDDYITSTHRGHGHCIAKGAELQKMAAELLGRATGYCKGRGGSMHIADVASGNLGANGIVGGGISLATGAALSSQLRKSGQVAVAFFGDGAAGEGSLHESANLASVWNLPVIYVCENNQYAMSAHVSTTSAVADLASRAIAWNMAGVNVDAFDPLAVYDSVFAAAVRARAGEGPTFVVCNGYRFRGHSVSDGDAYRDKGEIAAWREKDGLPRFRIALIERGILTPQAADHLEAEVHKEIEEAEEFARSSPQPDLSVAWEDVYA